MSTAVETVYNKLKKAQFDLDYGEDVTKQFFIDHFINNGIENPTIQLIYSAINKENEDHLTTKEFFEWQREQCTKRAIEEIMSKASNKEEWSKSYSIKFEYDSDEQKNTKENNATNETKEEETEATNINAEEQDKDWSKSYSIKFEYDEPQNTEERATNESKEEKVDTADNTSKKNNENNTETETQKLGNTTEIMSAESPKDIETTPLKTDKIAHKPPLEIRISQDFAGFLDSHSPKISPKKRNIGFSPKQEKPTHLSPVGYSPVRIAQKNVNFNQPNSPSISRSQSSRRVERFLADLSESESESENEANNEEEIAAEKKFRCMECTCYVMFLILFTGMAIFSIGSGDSNYTTTTSIRKPLIEVSEFIGWNGISEKKFDDISTVDDIYEYVKQVLLPFLLSDPRESNDSTVYYVQNRHILLGGIRMRQIRQKKVECKVCENVGIFDFKQCQTHVNEEFVSNCYTKDEMDRETVYFGENSNISYDYTDSSVLLDQTYRGKFDSYPGGGYIQDLPLEFNECLSVITALQRMQWLDTATLCLTIDFQTYSPSKSLHTVSRLVFEMPTSGIFATDELKTWKFDRYSGQISGFVLFAIHVIFMLFVVVISGVFMVDIFKNYFDSDTKQKRQMSGTNFWNKWRIMDSMNLIIFYITIGLFLHNENYQKSLIDIYDTDKYQSFRRLQALSLLEQFCFATNGFLLWVKLFKYLAVFPKFKFLFFMLQRGLQDIVMFIVLLFVFYLAFALAGFVMFSSDVSEYRTYGLSVVSMNLFMLTEMNYSDLVGSARLFGSVYYFSWLIWMTFILVNVFIAILIDSYSKTQVEIELNDSNAVHFNVFDKGRQYLKQLKLAQLMSRFEAIDEDGDDNVDVDEIAKALEIDREDAQRVMEKFDKDGNGVLDRAEFEKLKQRLIRDKMEHKPDYRKLNRHENILDQIDDMKDLMNRMLQIDPSGKRALKSRQGSK